MKICVYGKNIVPLRAFSCKEHTININPDKQLVQL